MLERGHTTTVTMDMNYLALSAELVSYLVIGVEHNQYVSVSINLGHKLLVSKIDTLGAAFVRYGTF